MPEKRIKRKPGRPKKADKPIGPDELLELEKLWLQNVPHTTIAAKFGVDEHTIRHYVNTRLRPAWRERAQRTLDEDLAETDRLASLAWEKIEEGEKDWRETVKWAIEHRAKCAGHYAPTRLSVEGDLRLAGVTPEEVDAAMFARLCEAMAKQKQIRETQDG